MTTRHRVHSRSSRSRLSWAVRLTVFLLSSCLFVGMGAFGCSGNDDCDYTFNVDDIGECGLLAAQLFCEDADFIQSDDCEYELGNIEDVDECENIADELWCEAFDYNPEEELCLVDDCICDDGICVLQDCICDDFDDDDF